MSSAPPADRQVLGLDVGATKALAVILGPRGRPIGRTWRTGRDLGPDRLYELVDEVLRWAEEDGARPAAMAVGFPGMVTPQGRVLSSVMVDGWDDEPLREALEARTGLRCPVDNDVNCAALGEHEQRGGREDLLLIAVGTGIGGALVLDGKVRAGSGGIAGEIGHTAGAPGTGPCDCGGRDCLHMVASSRAIEARLDIAPGSLERPAASSAAEDARRSALRDAAGAVGVAVASAVNLLDIPLVVLAGGVSRHAGYLEEVQRSFRRHAMAEHACSTRVEAAVGGYDVGARGAALLAASAIEDCGPA